MLSVVLCVIHLLRTQSEIILLYSIIYPYPNRLGIKQRWNRAYDIWNRLRKDTYCHPWNPFTQHVLRIAQPRNGHLSVIRGPMWPSVLKNRMRQFVIGGFLRKIRFPPPFSNPSAFDKPSVNMLWWPDIVLHL